MYLYNLVPFQMQMICRLLVLILANSTIFIFLDFFSPDIPDILSDWQFFDPHTSEAAADDWA